MKDENKNSEELDSPKRYNNGKVECIDAMESAGAGKPSDEAINISNVIKYLFRYPDKNGYEDLQKATWYLERLKRQVFAREFPLEKYPDDVKLVEVPLDEVRKSTTDIFTDSVQEFHSVFGHPVAYEPRALTADRFMFRLKMLRDEIDELEAAYMRKDLVETLDAYCDISYFLRGSIIESGMQYILEEAFKAVHGTNMKKSHDSVGEASTTAQHYTSEGRKAIVDTVEFNGRTYFNVLDDTDTDEKGKTLKPFGYDKKEAGRLLKQLIDKTLDQ